LSVEVALFHYFRAVPSARSTHCQTNFGLCTPHASTGQKSACKFTTLPVIVS
jgi:hypothetical protein